MRVMLDSCLDGMIVNDPSLMREVLAEEPYASLYRLATPADSQFEVHGPPAAAGVRSFRPGSSGGAAP
jgi:hypothetical protein